MWDKKKHLQISGIDKEKKKYITEIEKDKNKTPPQHEYSTEALPLGF